MRPASPCAVWSKLNCLKSSPLCSRRQTGNRLRPVTTSCEALGLRASQPPESGRAIIVMAKTGEKTTYPALPKYTQPTEIGIAYKPRGSWRRSHHSSQRMGKPFTRRRVAGDFDYKYERRYAECRTPTHYLQSCGLVEKKVSQ
jgi:hypothetical protein